MGDSKVICAECGFARLQGDPTPTAARSKRCLGSVRRDDSRETIACRACRPRSRRRPYVEGKHPARSIGHCRSRRCRRWSVDSRCMTTRSPTGSPRLPAEPACSPQFAAHRIGDAVVHELRPVAVPGGGAASVRIMAAAAKYAAAMLPDTPRRTPAKFAPGQLCDWRYLCRSATPLGLR